MTTIHLTSEVADALLADHGWTVCSQDAQGRAGGVTLSYTRPGHPSRANGGRFGDDYLWERDEALTQALSAAVAS